MNNKQKQYVKRDYRTWHEGCGLQYFNVKVKETDLAIAVDRESFTPDMVRICRDRVLVLRGELESYIQKQPRFKTSFDPLDLLPGAPWHAKIMADAARLANVGPMAAVAGTFSQCIGEGLMTYVKQVIVENGGDLYLCSSEDRSISVFAGESQFSNRVGIRVHAHEGPLGICTSSGTVGPSISLGRADAVVIKGKTAALADAVATGAANLVQTDQELQKAIEYARNIKGVTGVLAIKGDYMAAWGEIELMALNAR